MEFPVEIALTPIDAHSGLIVLATIVDITARRRAEIELAQRASELEHANERLAQFAYVASHDLQEPLRKIAVYAGLMEEAIANSDAGGVARATSVIATSAARARQLIDNLLTFSRVSGRETQAQRLSLRAEVELALSDLSASIQETAAEVRLDIPPLVVLADRAQLGRLIQNIVSNAIKYHKPNAAPAIEISRNARQSHGRAAFDRGRRNWLRGEIRQGNLRPVQTSARFEAIPRNRHRAGDLQGDRGSPRVDARGQVPPRRRLDLLRHAADGATITLADCQLCLHASGPMPAAALLTARAFARRPVTGSGLGIVPKRLGGFSHLRKLAANPAARP